MEDGLRAWRDGVKNEVKELGLNPCCYGRWSQRAKASQLIGPSNRVLILVVMEDGLRAWRDGVKNEVKELGLNPCCYGRWSQSSTYEDF